MNCDMLLFSCRDLRKALFGRYKRKERVDDDRRDDRGRGGPRPGGRDDFRDRRRERSPGGGDRRGRQDTSAQLYSMCLLLHSGSRATWVQVPISVN